MRRNFGKIVKICILVRLNLTFQAHVPVWDTVVRETLPRVAQSSKLKFNCTLLIWQIFQIS